MMQPDVSLRSAPVSKFDLNLLCRCSKVSLCDLIFNSRCQKALTKKPDYETISKLMEKVDTLSPKI